jgi:uncharacterized protein
MTYQTRFREVFTKNKTIIGMIHLAGPTPASRVERALEEVTIYENEGVDGAIVENYHGDVSDVLETLRALSQRKTGLALGLNLLGYPRESVRVARNYGLAFVQFDRADMLSEIKNYDDERKNLVILGGVRFKYTRDTGQTLEQDLNEGQSLCDAVVTTGEGTGMETPIEKLKDFKEIMRSFPLIVGAGVNEMNAYEQLRICNGAIIGSGFKYANHTRERIDERRVRKIMGIARGFNT